jgi:deoxyribonuclease-4|uniref:Probable endonuclease 4 n=1 Tax=candidate division WOR-3 bacterium TaxID=2052148 RepID=A0A7V6CME3_UNCW3
MRIGFHIAISGGFKKVVERAKKRGCETIQIFSRNPRGWRISKLNLKEVAIFRKELAENQIYPLFVHMPYLPNLASGKKTIFKKSLQALIAELERAEILGAEYVVMHIGKRMGTDEENALKNVAWGINEAFSQVKNKVILLLENTAGMGSEVGYNFESIKKIIDLVEDKERIGLVMDTAHIFEAGYNIATKEGLDETLRELDNLIGLRKLYLLHLNDSKTDLGSRVDRHWHIGKGKIGREGFKNILNHPLLKHLPAILETPKNDTKWDLMNLKMVRSLLE